MSAEKIRLYKDLDSMTDDKQIDLLRRSLEDRFGPLPEEVENLLIVVKIRNLGQKLGFEKIIIKNGMQIMFFVSNPMTQYYKSKLFEKVMSTATALPATYKFNQDGGRLRTVTRGIDTLPAALATLRQLA